MKKIHDPSAIHGPYRWDGSGGHARLNPHPTAVEVARGKVRVNRYVVWADGHNTAIGEAATLKEAQAVLDDHRRLLLGTTNAQSDQELG